MWLFNKLKNKKITRKEKIKNLIIEKKWLI